MVFAEPLGILLGMHLSSSCSANRKNKEDISEAWIPDFIASRRSHSPVAIAYLPCHHAAPTDMGDLQNSFRAGPCQH
jgi:hypothetical protein